MARRTIAAEVSIAGEGLHTGARTVLTCRPGNAGEGIIFRRSDLPGAPRIPATIDTVRHTERRTGLGSGQAGVETTEHVLAAACALELDDLLLDLDGPEPPILDGDALSYLELLESAGAAEQNTPRQAVKVLKTVTVENGDARASLLPADALSYAYELSFPVIGEQYFEFAFSRAGFKAEIAPARTFGFLRELETLNQMNLARGASLANTLALDDSGVVNRETQRFADEFVRHKILDAIGDMALAGRPLIARFEGKKSGHATNNALLRALFSDPANYAIREL